MSRIALVIDKFSRGRITPNMITATSLLGHVWIAYLIATRHPLWAGGLLIIFGIMDALDGALARVQNRASNSGMLIDASADRAKEVLLYAGTAYFFIVLDLPFVAVWSVTALGSSVLVSYIKAKGETALKDTALSANEINRVFNDGLARFEIRISLLIIGLWTALLPEILILITVLSLFTAAGRLIKITNKLNVQS